MDGVCLISNYQLSDLYSIILNLNSVGYLFFKRLTVNRSGVPNLTINSSLPLIMSI